MKTANKIIPIRYGRYWIADSGYEGANGSSSIVGGLSSCTFCPSLLLIPRFTYSLMMQYQIYSWLEFIMQSMYSSFFEPFLSLLLTVTNNSIDQKVGQKTGNRSQLFLLYNMNQNNKKGPQQPQLGQDISQLHPVTAQEDEIQSLQVQICEKMLEKLKKIYKNGKIQKFKQKSQKNNHLFHLMSEFFIRKKTNRQEIAEKKKLSKLQRVKARQHNILSTQQSLQLKEQQIENKETNFEKVRCHICSAQYSDIHDFYGFLCPQCATFNMEKREQHADMKGLVALVTGGRIKIGYQIGLRLLRQGATVIVTSRFSKDCQLRYQKQADYSSWKDNLVIYQCDFLAQIQVSSLIQFIRLNYKKLDILINNAAQTLVRPKEFFTKQLQNEMVSLQEDTNIAKSSQIRLFSNPAQLIPSLTANTISVKPGEIDLDHTDQFGQPIDKRETNSWIQKIQDVPLIDCYTTQVINSIVPFYLISQLKQIMTGSTPSWILNVSSMEGVFNRNNKQEFHPHTNMAKAALNMITRTSAQQFKKHNIFMNSVDTGWVTNENPYHISQVMAKDHLFQCPLDCIDGAMRVLDPIYHGLLKKQFPYGQFLKNYHPSSW